MDNLDSAVCYCVCCVLRFDSVQLHHHASRQDDRDRFTCTCDLRLPTRPRNAQFPGDDDDSIPVYYYFEGCSHAVPYRRGRHFVSFHSSRTTHHFVVRT